MFRKHTLLFLKRITHTSCKELFLVSEQTAFKGGHLDFSHLTELKNIYVTEIYMKNKYKSSTTKNHRIKINILFDCVPLKGYIAS